MVGGNIPGVTKVLSISMYEQVEVLDFASAHKMAALLLLFSFVVLGVGEDEFLRRISLLCGFNALTRILLRQGHWNLPNQKSKRWKRYSLE